MRRIGGLCSALVALAGCASLVHTQQVRPASIDAPLAYCNIGGPASSTANLSLFTISWHHGAPCNNPPDQEMIRAATDDLYDIVKTMNPADMVFVVPASPYECDWPNPADISSWGCFEGSSIFHDELNKDFQTQFTERPSLSLGQNLGIQITGVTGLKLGASVNVAALVWGSNWELVQGPVVVPFTNADVCGITQPEARAFSAYVIERKDDHRVKVRLVAVQTESNSDCGAKGQVTAATNYAVNSRGADGIDTFLAGDFNKHGVHGTILGDDGRPLVSCQACDSSPIAALDCSSGDSMHDMEIFQLISATATPIQAVLVDDQLNAQWTSHFYVPGVNHSIAGVTLAVQPQ